jgi:hypothetical protein
MATQTMHASGNVSHDNWRIIATITTTGTIMDGKVLGAFC